MRQVSEEEGIEERGNYCELLKIRQISSMGTQGDYIQVLHAKFVYSSREEKGRTSNEPRFERLWFIC